MERAKVAVLISGSGTNMAALLYASRQPDAPYEVVLVLDAAAVSRNKLRVDSRKWIAAKLKPRVYGDKVQVEGVIDHKGMADDVLLARLAKFGVALPGIVPKPEQEAPDVGGQ